MNETPEPTSPSEKSDFAEAASHVQKGMVAELLTFLTENKKWWLLPIVITLLLIGVLVLLSGTAAAPFIYTLF